MSQLSSRVLVILLGVFLTASVFMHTPIQGLGNQDRSSDWARVPLPIIRLPEFLAGMILGLCLLRRKPQFNGGTHPVRVALAVGTSVVLLSVPIGPWVSPRRSTVRCVGVRIGRPA